MRILVTGGTGRIGRQLVRALQKKGFEVRVFTRKPEKEVGVETTGELNASGCRAVIHLAASIDYLAPEEELFEANVELTRKALAAAKKAKARFVFMSSTSLYHAPPSLPINEEQEPTPVNAYGRSKLAAEQLVKNSGLTHCIVRAPMVYGPGFKTGFCKVFKLLRKGKLQLIGNGKNRIAFIHVDDLVSALLLALKEKGEFIVDSGEQYSQKELYSLACRELGVKTPHNQVPKWLAYALARASTFYAKAFHKKPLLLAEEVNTLAQDRVFDCSRARALGFKPRKKLARELPKVIRECEKK